MLQSQNGGLAFYRQAMHVPSKEEAAPDPNHPLAQLLDCIKKGDTGSIPAAAAGYCSYIRADRKRAQLAFPVAALAVFICTRYLARHTQPPMA